MDRDRVFNWLFALFFVGIVLVLVYNVYWDCTHVCVRSHQVFMPRRCEVTSYDTDSPFYMQETCTEGHYETVCDEWKEKP